MKRDILSLTPEEIKSEFKEAGVPVYRAAQLFEFLHKKSGTCFGDATILPAELRKKLDNEYFIFRNEISAVSSSKVTETKKFLFTLSGERVYTESVFMKEKGRVTYCISSQAGCNAGCIFCATGYLGLMKNLTAGEIVSQVYEIIRSTGTPPTNIVFMGMGEPFLNYHNVLKALKILTSELGINIPSRRITVSTIGIKDRIRDFADDLTNPLNKEIKNTKLALSLHSVKEEVRKELIPLASKYRLKEIYNDLIYYYKKTGSKITYEYIFFDGLNNGKDDIKKLIKLSGMLPSNINIIPFHPIKNIKETGKEIDKYLKAENNSLLKNNINDFITELRNHKVPVHVRSSNGIDIEAACGQLAAEYKNKRRNMYRIIIFGPPGVGKGTQAALIASNLGLFHLSTGEYLRKAIEEGTELGKKAKEIMDRGELVSDEIMIGIVKEALVNNTTSSGFILDGFPRTIKQAEELEKIFSELGHSDITILSLSADSEEITRRLIKRGRSDDTEETIKNRLAVYEKTTAPVISFYTGKHRILNINGIGEIGEISDKIHKVLSQN
jgi:23S rRNA (adenine2503-C2)-methyltransferase